MRTMKAVLLLVMGVVVAAACAKPPQAEIDAAQAMLDSARAAEAEEYAPQSLTAAEDAMAALEAEIEAQAGKFSLLRSYDEAQVKAAAALESARQGMADATTAKEQARIESSDLLARVTAELEEASNLLVAAPTGKGTATDIAALRADLQSAAATLNEATQAHGAGHYKEALAKATAAMATIESVTQAIESARQARRRS